MGVAAAVLDQLLEKTNAPMKYLLLLLLTLATMAGAQTDFHAYLTTETLLDDGVVEKLTIVTSNLQFTIRPPREWSRQVNEPGQKIIFESQSGRSAITIQFTGNSPGQLPDEDTLRAQLLQANPGADIRQVSICPTSYKPGVFFDLVMQPAPGASMKARHAFVAEPAGQAEFVLSANSDEFDKSLIVFMATARSFRLEPIKPKEP
jgi:hypothetical protein